MSRYSNDPYARAEQIALALGGSGRPAGRWFSAPCPVHGGKGKTSLGLRPSDDGIGYSCFGGCDAKAINAAVEQQLGVSINERSDTRERPVPVTAAVNKSAAPTKRQRSMRDYARFLWESSDSVDHNFCPVHLWAQRKYGLRSVSTLDCNVRWLHGADGKHGVIVPIAPFEAYTCHARQVLPPGVINAVQVVFLDYNGNQVKIKHRGNFVNKLTYGAFYGGVFAVGDLETNPIVVTEGVADLLAVTDYKGAQGVALLGTAGFHPAAPIVNSLRGRSVVVCSDGGEPGKVAADRFCLALGAAARTQCIVPPLGISDPADMVLTLRTNASQLRTAQPAVF